MSDGLPAGAVATTTARAAGAAAASAAAHLGIAIAAIDRLIAAWLERHTSLAATV
jgi:hypothetical protein